MILSNTTHAALAINTFGDKYFYFINGATFNKVSAKVVFETSFNQALFNEDSLYIIVGTDSGLLPKFIQQQGIPSGTRYIFIEPEEILNLIEQQGLLDNLPSEIACTTLESWQKLSDDFKINDYFYINSVKLHNSIGAQQATLQDYPELSWQLNEILQSLHWQYNVAIGCEAFMIRQLENLADNILPASLLEDAYRGQTVIILAGGPSLTYLLPWIKQHRNKLTVFSVSRVSRQLISANIEPDFVFSVDPYEHSAEVSKEMFKFGDNTIFVHSHHAYPTLINQWHGKSLYLGERFPWETKLNIENINSVGPTVTNTALNTAHRFGFSRILLAGFDLCFTKEGITHAIGSNEQLAGPKYDLTSLQVETYCGEKRPTGQDYYAALSILSRQAQSITADNRKIINLAKTAAKVAFIDHIPPEKITLDELDTLPDVYAAHLIPCLSEPELSEHYAAISMELEKALHHLKGIKTLAKKAIKINEEMYNLEGQIANYRDKRNLDTIEKRLHQKYRNYSALVKRFGIRNFLKIAAPNKDNWDAEYTKKIGRIYYDAFQIGSTRLIKQVEDALSRTRSRQEELINKPDFSRLFNQWNKDKSYNRARLWLKRHPTAYLSPETKNEIASLSKKFDAFLTSDITTLNNQARTSSRLPEVKTRALLLLNHKKTDELKDLYNALEPDSKEPDKEPYLLLISAFIAELEENDNQALNYYDAILNLDNSPLIEEALLRITSISLKQLNDENAFMALECLAQINPIYLPLYAESARILGRLMIAIDSYNNYLSQFPEDLQCQLKLTDLYLENHIPDAAEMMLNHILDRTPDLEAAILLKKKIADLKDQNQQQS